MNQTKENSHKDRAPRTEEIYETSPNNNLGTPSEVSGVEKSDATDSSRPRDFPDSLDGAAHGPINPDSDSPVKNALLKRTSQDYMNVPREEELIAKDVSNAVFAEACPQGLDDTRKAHMGVVPEEGGDIMAGPLLEGQPRLEAEWGAFPRLVEGREAEEKVATSESGCGQLDHKESDIHTSVVHCNHGNETELGGLSAVEGLPSFAAQSLSISANESKEYSLGSQSHSTLHQVTHTQKTFVSSVTVASHSKEVLLKVSPSQVTQAEQPASQELPESNEQKYRVTRSVARQNETSYAVESVTRDVTDQSLAAEPASVTQFSQEKPAVMSEYKVTFENSTGNVAVPEADTELFAAEKGETPAEERKPKLSEMMARSQHVPHVLHATSENSHKTETTRVTSTRIVTVNYSARAARAVELAARAVDSSPETSESSDETPSGSLMNISGNMVIDEEEECESGGHSEEGASEREEESTDHDSDTESFMSAKDDVTSDTDTAGYVTAHATGSSASQEYLSVDTDTDTIDFESARDLTPVNSDTEEEEEMREPGTPVASRGALRDFEPVDQRGNLAEQMLQLGSGITSQGELGYRGDTEEGLASEEDLRV